MKHSQKRIFMDIEKMTSDEFKAFCRSGNKNYFTRIRKMPLQDLLFTMINRKGLTLALELRNYMKLAHPGVSISKPGYLKQRMKLNPDAFLELYKYHNRNFYADSTFSTYKDHLILAADGSDINIPTTAETLKLYGSASRKNTKPQAQIGLGCIYDVMNRMILESDCNKVKFNEMRLAEKQMERIPETIGSIPYVIIMDRGYPSTPAFIHMMDKDIKFIVRLKSSDYKKEQNSLIEKDQLVKIKLDKSRIRHYEGTPDGERMKELGEISLRMVKILLENGSLEVLATNLSDQFIIHSICSITNHDYFAIIRYQISNHDWYRTTVLPEHNALLQFSQPSQLPDRHLHRPIFAFFCFSYFMITQFDFLFVPFCTNTPFCCKETNIRETVLLDTPICSA